MITKFIDKKIDYDGSQLRSHFIFDTTGITGDACIAFMGGCNILSEHMVDLADKRDNCGIYSEEMLHFIAERFNDNLDNMILHQRLFVGIMKDVAAKFTLPNLGKASFAATGKASFAATGKASFAATGKASPRPCSGHGSAVTAAAIERRGNDLYDESAKLNISIATASPVSCLMHVGINVSSKNTPVKTKSLKDYGINPKTFAEEVLKRYKEEVEEIKTARSKVKWVK